MSVEMTQEEWIQYGMDRKYCGPVVCATHDGVPTSEDEDNQWYQGDDPCQPVIRVYHDELEAMLIEQNHSPSQWRKNFPA